VLMTVLLMMAAQFAGISRLVYHTVDATGSDPTNGAVRPVASQLLPRARRRPWRISCGRCTRWTLAWGASDGN
jgi:hypothetical protein